MSSIAVKYYLSWLLPNAVKYPGVYFKFYLVVQHQQKSRFTGAELTMKFKYCYVFFARAEFEKIHGLIPGGDTKSF